MFEALLNHVQIETQTIQELHLMLSRRPFMLKEWNSFNTSHENLTQKKLD